ncbi:hypothetical protein [Catenovulum agarivorans]|uniref:hypothetical protein n=1 Tax=Catenovulum agarivorans TaxID=1172192 RepID=UPI00037F8EBF|nr:hypothetical protein [Catenovulum agarivorans]
MLQFNKNIIAVNGNEIELPHTIIDATEVGDNICVIFDYMEFNVNSAASNLQCIDYSGSVVWVAENPTNQNTDAYTNFIISSSSESYITVGNFVGCNCKINVTTGKLIQAALVR